MKNFFDVFAINFGYTGINDLLSSLFNIALMPITLPLSSIGALLTFYFGLDVQTMVAFIILLIMELATGLMAAKVRGEKIQSKKMSRFGIKLFVWVALFGIINVLGMQYTGLLQDSFSYLHTTIFVYVCVEYLISILENIGVITGKKNTKLIDLIKNKFPFLKEGETDFFEGKDKIMLMLDVDLNILKSTPILDELIERSVDKPKISDYCANSAEIVTWFERAKEKAIDDEILTFSNNKKIKIDVRYSEGRYLIVGVENY